MDEKTTRMAEIYNRIIELMRLLQKSDYIVIKIAEGAASAAEYADDIALRRDWRAEINVLKDEYQQISGEAFFPPEEYTPSLADFEAALARLGVSV